MEPHDEVAVEGGEEFAEGAGADGAAVQGVSHAIAMQAGGVGDVGDGAIELASPGVEGVGELEAEGVAAAHGGYWHTRVVAPRTSEPSGARVTSVVMRHDGGGGGGGGGGWAVTVTVTARVTGVVPAAPVTISVCV